MLTISHALSVSSAETYYQSEYANPAMIQSEYCQEKGEAHGEWVGALAEEWEISGPMTEEQFRHAINGQHPVSGEQLVKHVEAASVRNEEINRKARDMQKRLEVEGERVKWGAGLKQAAAKLNRQGKKYDKAEMERMDAELEEKFGRQAHLEAAAIRERGPIVYSQEEMG
jgi:hypothetical protein